MDKSTLVVEWVPRGRLFGSPSNPRQNDAAVPHVAASLRRFGWRQPIVARPSGELVAGHTRLRAAEELGMDEVPVAWFDGTDLEATAYRIADNRTHEFASWDEPALAELLDELRSEDALDGVGYTGDDIDALLDEIRGDEDGEVEEVPVPSPAPAAVSEVGDLWVLGEHRLLCGDSGENEVLDRLLDGEPVHLLHTDPPYNVGVEPRSNTAIAAGLSSFEGSGAGAEQLRAKDRPITNDALSEEEFAARLRGWFGNASRVLLPGRAFYVWGGYANCASYPAALLDAGLYFSQAIIWDKQHPVLNRKDFMGAHEWCFYGWREGEAHQFFGPDNVPDLWSVKKLHHTETVHLTEKPAELAARAIRYSSRPGEHVLDLFGGSGSTLMAAEQLNRRAYLVELDPLYVDVIIERWQSHAGREAILESTGEAFAQVRDRRAP